MSPMCVAQLMHPCASATVHSGTTLREAAGRVLATGLESLPVVDSDGVFTGLVAQAALIRELLCVNSHSAIVASIVSHHVESARHTATLDSILPLFRCAAVTMIPIVDDAGQPVGLIHRRDVIRYLLADSPAEDNSAEMPQDTTSRPHFLAERSQAPKRQGQDT